MSYTKASIIIILVSLLISGVLASCSIYNNKKPVLYAYYKNTNESNYNQTCTACTETINDAGVIAFTEYWKIIYNPNQAYLSRMVLIPFRHFPDYESMSDEEMKEYQQILKILLPVVKETFNVTHFNVAYLMNMAYNKDHPDPRYKNGQPSPHFHWHIIPRYNGKREFGGETFFDPDFGDTFNFKRKQYLLGKFRQNFIESIKSKLKLHYIDCNCQPGMDQ